MYSTRSTQFHFTPRTSNESPEGKCRYGSTLSLTTALDVWVVNAMPRPFPPPPGRETWYPLYNKLGEPQGQSGQVCKISPPGFDPRTVWSVLYYFRISIRAGFFPKLYLRLHVE